MAVDLRDDDRASVPPEPFRLAVASANACDGRRPWGRRPGLRKRRSGRPVSNGTSNEGSEQAERAATPRPMPARPAGGWALGETACVPSNDQGCRQRPVASPYTRLNPIGARSLVYGSRERAVRSGGDPRPPGTSRTDHRMEPASSWSWSGFDPEPAPSSKRGVRQHP